MFAHFAAVLVFAVLGTAFVFGSLAIGRLARPSRPTPEKATIYECGEPTIGSAWVRFNSRFYTIALVFLLFDVEVVLLLPAGLVLRELAGAGFGTAALVGVLVFVALLVVGLAYEWYYGNLDWVRQTEEIAQAREALAEDEAAPRDAATAA